MRELADAVIPNADSTRSRSRLSSRTATSSASWPSPAPARPHPAGGAAASRRRRRGRTAGHRRTAPPRHRPPHTGHDRQPVGRRVRRSAGRAAWAAGQRRRRGRRRCRPGHTGAAAAERPGRAPRVARRAAAALPRSGVARRRGHDARRLPARAAAGAPDAGADQFDNARAAVAAGAAIQAESDPDAVAAATRRVLAEPGFRRAARLIQADLRPCITRRRAGEHLSGIEDAAGRRMRRGGRGTPGRSRSGWPA